MTSNMIILSTSASTLTLLAGVGVFLLITLLLVAVLLVAKHYLVHSVVEADSGKALLGTMADTNLFLPSACGGKGSCGQCKVQVFEGGGNILPTETVHFSRKQIQDHWRLACQVKVKEDMKIGVPASVLDIKEWECEVISNRNVATFIKEFIVALPPGQHMDFLPGSYAQIKIPAFSMDYDKDIDKSLIGDEYLPAWEKFGLFTLKCHNDEPTVRAYSMANYPAEGDRIMLTVRIATPPFKPKPQVGFQDVMPGIASSYIFTLKPGDKAHERSLRRLPPDIRLQKRDDVDRRWRRYGSSPCPNHAHDTHTQYPRPRNELFLWRTCLERGFLFAGFLAA